MMGRRQCNPPRYRDVEIAPSSSQTITVVMAWGPPLRAQLLLLLSLRDMPSSYPHAACFNPARLSAIGEAV